MIDWRQQRWFLGAAVLKPGHGGIARVARMSARAMIETGAPLDMLALVDDSATEIAGVRSDAVAGKRTRFATRMHLAAGSHMRFLYDAVGPARAHPRLPGLRRPYGVWIHGVEVWDNLTADRARSLRGAEFVLVNSEFTRRRFEELHWKLDNAHVCHLATEEDDLPDQPARGGGPPTALLIGRSDKDNFRKGHTEVVMAWEHVVKAIPDAELLLAGGGDGLELLKVTVAKSPVRDQIKVLGFVPEDDMPALWARADVLCQPSWKEGFGLVYIESMRHNVPVIASIHDAGAEVNLDGETGFNVALDEPAALPDRLIKLLSDQDLARRMGAAGQKRWLEQFRYSAFRDRLTTILDRVEPGL